MTGQPSGRVMWRMPRVYQRTMSVFSIGRPALVQAGKPVAAGVLVRVIPGGKPLGRAERGDPQVPDREGGALGYRGVGVG
jgi:hypothetical protein